MTTVTKSDLRNDKLILAQERRALEYREKTMKEHLAAMQTKRSKPQEENNVKGK